MRLAYRKGVLAQWGLIAKGPVEALPYVLGLLAHPVPEARRAGAGVLQEWIERKSELFATLVAAAESETDPEALSTLAGTLGRTGDRRALPILARLMRDPAMHVGDVHWSALEAVSKIAGDCFERRPDPLEAADAWLRRQGV